MIKNREDLSSGQHWLDVTDPTEEEMRTISAEYGLHEQIMRDCMQPEHLPKYESVDDVNFLILRFYARQQMERVSTIQELTNKVAVFYTDEFIVTIHKNETPFLEEIRKRFVETKKCKTLTDVITKIAWNALESFDKPFNQISEKIDFHENQIMLRSSGVNQTEGLYMIKREVTLAHKTIMLMLEPINHIYVGQGEEATLQDVKDQHLKMQTLYHQAIEDVTNLLHVSLAFSAQKTNEVVKVLTLFSVFFMPLTFIVGVYGMNFDFMPELRQKWGYPGVMILMGVMTLIIYFWFRKKRWL